MPSARSSTSRPSSNDVIHAEQPGEISGVIADRRRARRAGRRALAVRPPRRRGRAAPSSSSAACRATIRGCRTCFGRSSRPPAIASIGDDDEDAADLVIAAQGSDVADDAATQTIWLRTEPEAAGKKDDSIYRYDRAGLLMALKSAGAGRGK